MEAQDEKQAAAKKSSIFFNQHHQVHLVCHHGNKATHTDTPAAAEASNEALFSLITLCSPCPSSYRLSAETRKEEGGGEEEERVGGPGAGEDSEQITIL